MKNVFALLVCLLVIMRESCFGQQKPALDSCRQSFKADIQAFIPGYRDTVMYNNQSLMTLNPSSLMNGFELKLMDTTYRLVRFNLTFDDGQNLYSMPSVGNKIIPDNKSVAALKKIVAAQVITVDNIIVAKDNQCYIIQPKAYFIF